LPTPLVRLAEHDEDRFYGLLVDVVEPIDELFLEALARGLRRAAATPSASTGSSRS
jgi:hypothetical protein